MAVVIKKQRKDLSLKEKQRILENYDKLPKMSQRSAAEHLKISQPVLCNILKNRCNIESSALTSENMNRKRVRGGKNSDVESALKIWFCDIRRRSDSINGRVIRQKAEELAKSMGNENFKATDGWFSRWKKRENIVYNNIMYSRRLFGMSKKSEMTSPVLETVMVSGPVIKEELLGDNPGIKEEPASDAEEEAPTGAEMREALRILRRGVEHRTRNLDRHNEYERFIEELLRENDDPN